MAGSFFKSIEFKSIVIDEIFLTSTHVFRVVLSTRTKGVNSVLKLKLNLDQAGVVFENNAVFMGYLILCSVRTRLRCCV